jgi:CheY-like chemotaxis protein
VITDLIMPVLDGLQMIQRYLQQPGPHVPVIAVSAVGSRLRAARDLGAVEVMLKPVHPVELANTARKHARAAAP